MFAYLNARKEGCALLALACVLLIGWVRSYVLTDEYVTFRQYSDDKATINFYRSSDCSIRYMRKHIFRNKVVRENQLWSVHYVALVLPVTLVAGYLILRPLRKSMRLGELIVTIILCVVLVFLVL